MSTPHPEIHPLIEDTTFEGHLYSNLLLALGALETSDDEVGRQARHAGGTVSRKGRAAGTMRKASKGPSSPSRNVVVQSKHWGAIKRARGGKTAIVSGSVIREAIRRAMAETTASFGDPVVMRIAGVVGRTLPEARRHVSEATIEKMVDALIETQDPIARVSAEIDASNANARMTFMSKFRTLTADEVSAASGSRATNKHQTASRWKSEGKIFSVPWQRMERYPDFQFDHGFPRAVVARVLALLPQEMSQWEIAFWFVSTNGWLDGAAPIDRFGDVERTVEAARMEGEAVIG